MLTTRTTLDGWIVGVPHIGNPDARSTMIGEIQAYGIRSFDLSQFTDEQLFDLWSLVAANRDLFQHAQPHHHREIAVRIQNGRDELWHK